MWIELPRSIKKTFRPSAIRESRSSWESFSTIEGYLFLELNRRKDFPLKKILRNDRPSPIEKVHQALKRIHLYLNLINKCHPIACNKSRYMLSFIHEPHCLQVHRSFFFWNKKLVVNNVSETSGESERVWDSSENDLLNWDHKIMPLVLVHNSEPCQVSILSVVVCISYLRITNFFRVKQDKKLVSFGHSSSRWLTALCYGYDMLISTPMCLSSYFNFSGIF